MSLLRPCWVCDAQGFAVQPCCFDAYMATCLTLYGASPYKIQTVEHTDESLQTLRERVIAELVKRKLVGGMDDTAT